MNIYPYKYKVDRLKREILNGHKGHVILFTGLSGSGKSTIASFVEYELYQKGIKTFVLDGDNIRSGLNFDLDFSNLSRKENLRRVAHVSKLMCDAGIVVLTAFISPFKEDRNFFKNICGEDFSEIYISTPLEICKKRDVKGLYKKAFSGEITDFTGIDSPYEKPLSPDLDLRLDKLTLSVATTKIIKYLESKLKLK